MTLRERPRGVLVLGAHPDDCEIGCGGTLLRLAERWPGLPVTVVVLTGTPERHAVARRAAALFLPGCDVTVHTFGPAEGLADGRLPAAWETAKECLEDVAARAGADVVLAPRQDDAHQDHRLVAQLVPTVWRNHLVLGYEIPKYDGDLGRPNVYVPLPADTVREKVRLLEKAYPSQTGRDWWDSETFLGLARLRGMECRETYAEAFTVAKAVVTW
jgi:LmbE family N-acetylglucosaminyl deacetylase